MAKIVGIHGIGHQYQGENTVHARWLPALKDGLLRAGGPALADDDLRCAFYGDVFRQQDLPTPSSLPRGAGADETSLDPWEEEMLGLWVLAAAEQETGPIPAAVPALTPSAAPRFVQGSLERLSRSKFFAGVAENALILDLKQVRLYLQEDRFRQEVQQRVAQTVGEDTRVIIGHSLGSIVAYEAVAAHPEWNVTTLVTIGSPLGIRNLIFDQLRPAPQRDVGVWPASLARWTNIADDDDIVALVKTLSDGFGDGVDDLLIDNGAQAHSATSYLTARETGQAIAAGL